MMTFQMDATVAHRMTAGQARAGVDRLIRTYEDGVQDLLEHYRGKPLVDVEPEVQRVLESIGACPGRTFLREAAVAIQHGRPFDVTVQLVAESRTP